MAYVKPRIRFRENDRHIPRGCYWDAQIGRFTFQATENETRKIILDYTDLLDGATITVALTEDGLEATSAITSGQVTLTISDVSCTAKLDVVTTFSDGRIRQDNLYFVDPYSWSRDDYRPYPSVATV